VKTAAGKTLPDYDSAVVVALGSNLGSPSGGPAEILHAAQQAMDAAGLKVVRRSALWRSSAWPDPAEPAYLNAVVLVETAFEPPAVLTRLHAIEAALGRERGAPNAARTLDLDLIAYARCVRARAPVLPHPRAADRLFVMGPLAEIAPGWRHPLTGRTAAELAKSATIGLDARPLPGGRPAGLH
jgi:2-amino-4-hydroxy-6-hydroxymethyldihydropteridine diphosphokinase